MYNNHYEAESARSLLNERLRDAEERRMIRLMQYQRPSLLSILYDRLVGWAHAHRQANPVSEKHTELAVNQRQALSRK